MAEINISETINWFDAESALQDLTNSAGGGVVGNAGGGGATISSMEFDEATRELTLEMDDGVTKTTVITGDSAGGDGSCTVTYVDVGGTKYIRFSDGPDTLIDVIPEDLASTRYVVSGNISGSYLFLNFNDETFIRIPIEGYVVSWIRNEILNKERDVFVRNIYRIEEDTLVGKIISYCKDNKILNTYVRLTVAPDDSKHLLYRVDNNGEALLFDSRNIIYVTSVAPDPEEWLFPGEVCMVGRPITSVIYNKTDDLLMVSDAPTIDIGKDIYVTSTNFINASRELQINLSDNSEVKADLSRLAYDNFGTINPNPFFEGDDDWENLKTNTEYTREPALDITGTTPIKITKMGEFTSTELYRLPIGRKFKFVITYGFRENGAWVDNIDLRIDMKLKPYDKYKRLINKLFIPSDTTQYMTVTQDAFAGDTEMILSGTPLYTGATSTKRYVLYFPLQPDGRCGYVYGSTQYDDLTYSRLYSYYDADNFIDNGNGTYTLKIDSGLVADMPAGSKISNSQYTTAVHTIVYAYKTCKKGWDTRYSIRTVEAPYDSGVAGWGTASMIWCGETFCKLNGIIGKIRITDIGDGSAGTAYPIEVFNTTYDRNVELLIKQISLFVVDE